MVHEESLNIFLSNLKYILDNLEKDKKEVNNNLNESIIPPLYSHFYLNNY